MTSPEQQAELSGLPDEHLAVLAREGLMPAFEMLVFKYEPRVRRFVEPMCASREDAAEVTQDAFLRAFRALDRYDAARPFAPWLFTIARRLATDKARNRVPVCEVDPERIVDENDPSRAAERVDEAAALWRKARSTLPQPQFQALWLRYIEDLDVAGIASVLGLTKVYVKVLLFRARRGLLKETNNAAEKQRAFERSTPLPPAPLVGDGLWKGCDNV